MIVYLTSSAAPSLSNSYEDPHISQRTEVNSRLLHLCRINWVSLNSLFTADFTITTEKHNAVIPVSFCTVDLLTFTVKLLI